jgi:hypothetical protein
MPIGGGYPSLLSQGFDVRLVLILIIVSLVGPPAFAKSEPRRRECHRLTSQIARYEGDVERARERGDELWENATREHIGRLSERRVSRCPQFADDGAAARRWRQFGQMLGTAAKLAAKYFTMGAY